MPGRKKESLSGVPEIWSHIQTGECKDAVFGSMQRPVSAFLYSADRTAEHPQIPGIPPPHTAQTSTDLQNWTTEDVTLSAIGEDNRCTASVNPDVGERYLRLRIGAE